MSNPENKDQLRQTLLELHYDLLDEKQASRLRAQIATDPAVAAEWARTLAWAEKLADAAKFDSAALAPIDLSAALSQAESDPAAPSSNGKPHDPQQPLPELQPSDDAERSVTPSRPQSRRWWRRSIGLAATAAAIGLMIIGGGYFDRAPSAPAGMLRLEAQPVASAGSASEQEFRVLTSRVDSPPWADAAYPVVPANLSFSVIAKNAVLFSGEVDADDGSGRIALPNGLIIPKDATLRVTARSNSESLSSSTIDVPLEPTRCLTYLKVDRPVYRPGETVFFRSLTLQRRTLQANSDVPIRFELLDPSGAPVSGAVLEGVTERGVGNGAFTIPQSAAGGRYVLVARSLDGFFPEEQCEFDVRAYRVPRFKKELEFSRRSYGPGDRVEADFSATHAAGGPVAGARLRIQASVDGKLVHESLGTTSSSGRCLVAFELPALIRDGAGQLSVMIDDGATRETQSKTIPIQIGRVAVDFYPEGGYLVSGLQNRVYFVARDSLGQPIHLAGEILDRSGQRVTEIETRRDGMGRFQFTPNRGERYTLKVTSPVDISNSPRLPAVVNDLPVLDTGAGVIDAGQPIDLVIRSSGKRKAIVRAVCRGSLIGEIGVQLQSGDNRLTLPIGEDAGGVIRVTVFDNESGVPQPLVERLIFRRSSRRLQVEIVDSVSAQSPGDPLRLTLQVRDETGEPAPAVLGVSVVDDAALSLATSEQPGIETHFLLTSEVEKPEDLEHANFYLSDDPEAAESIDLLLGTQGWRRFISGASREAEVDFREQLIRLLELDGDTMARAAGRIDNGGLLAQQWTDYSAAAHAAWQRLLDEARVVMLVVLGIWLLSILVHIRQQARVNVAVLLIAASTSLLIYGCGSGQVATVIEAPADNAKTADNEANYVEAEMQQDMDVGAEPDSEPSQAFMVDAPSASQKKTEPDEQPGGQMQLALSDIPFSGRIGTALGLSDEDGKRRSITEQELDRLLAARGLDRESLADQLLDELRFPVRQYAHQSVTRDREVRDDFAETLYWQPMLVTDSQGRATIRFDLSDSVTTFRVNVDGHSADGRIGSGGGEVRSRLPFQIEPTLPLEVTLGDRIDLPVAIINSTNRNTEVEVSVAVDDSLQPVGELSRNVALPAKGRRREHISLNVVSGAAESAAQIELRAHGAGTLADSVRRRLRVAPAGYPDRESIAGQLNGRKRITIPVPDAMVPDSLAVTVRAYPSPLADVMSGVESILREPHGCFEQASATNYPNTMALLYMQRTETTNPEVSRRALGMLDRGYEKLISFECENLGYEWFGDDPGHEALSAFGLMQFTDMAKVMSVSEEMIARTRKWLMSRRDGKGGFHRNASHLHVWSVKQPIVNAYVLWAMTEADVAAGQPLRATSELAGELDLMARLAKASDDPYMIALSARTLMNVERRNEGESLLERLAGLQQNDGSLQGKTTVVSSGGLSLKMETTALATLAWVKSPKYIENARASSAWIAGNRLGHGGFGSTQATVLALKALVAMSAHGSATTGGTLQVLLGGEIVASAPMPDQPASGQAVEIAGLGAALERSLNGGSVEIELVGVGAQRLSYTIDVSCHVVTAPQDDDCAVRLSTEMIAADGDDDVLAAGDVRKVVATLENTTTQGQPMTVAIVGLPGGVEARTEELDELRAAGRFDFYELRGRDVVFYWRTIEPEEVKRVEFHVTAVVPGKYTGPASRAYLYYTAEKKRWAEPMTVEIEP